MKNITTAKEEYERGLKDSLNGKEWNITSTNYLAGYQDGQKMIISAGFQNKSKYDKVFGR